MAQDVQSRRRRKAALPGNHMVPVQSTFSVLTLREDILKAAMSTGIQTEYMFSKHSTTDNLKVIQGSLNGNLYWAPVYVKH